GAMPSSWLISSFDSPCAISSMISRCRSVIASGSRRACIAREANAKAAGAASAARRIPPRRPPEGREYTVPPMFEALSDRLGSALGGLRGKGRLDEEAISRAMREVRLALLEADVNLEVVRDFVARVRERALGEEVQKSLTPGQQVVKIVHEELTELMGSASAAPAFGKFTVILLAGLQGSGKTTAAAKLALRVRKDGHKPGLVAADLQRPAAIDQLEQLGRQIDVPVYRTDTQNPVEAATAGL